VGNKTKMSRQKTGMGSNKKQRGISVPKKKRSKGGTYEEGEWGGKEGGGKEKQKGKNKYS